MTEAGEVPALVSRALRASLARGYLEATRSETGRLIAVLAASRGGTIGEAGTGCAVGTAWLRTGAPPGTRVVTAEQDAELACVARDVLHETDVTVINSDWHGLAEHAPFSLIFMDAHAATDLGRDQIHSALDDHGIVVIDDFPAADPWSGEVRAFDTLRQEWLSDDRFTAAEVAVAGDSGVVIATRR